MVYMTRCKMSFVLAKVAPRFQTPHFKTIAGERQRALHASTVPALWHVCLWLLWTALCRGQYHILFFF